MFAPGDPSALNESGRALGVHVARIELDRAPFRKVYDPGNPYARPEGDPDAGYVYFPNIDSVTENVNMVEASRAYEANIQAAEASKTMFGQALRLIG